jgi:hypothetical protein
MKSLRLLVCLLLILIATSLVAQSDTQKQSDAQHMVARKSVDGKTVEFDFVDLLGGNEYGICITRSLPRSTLTITSKIRFT